MTPYHNKLKAEAECHNSLMSHRVEREDIALDVELGVIGVDGVEGLEGGIVGVAILVCEVEVYVIVELKAEACGDDALAGRQRMGEYHILVALT